MDSIFFTALDTFFGKISQVGQLSYSSFSSLLQMPYDITSCFHACHITMLLLQLRVVIFFICTFSSKLVHLSVTHVLPTSYVKILNLNSKEKAANSFIITSSLSSSS